MYPNAIIRNLVFLRVPDLKIKMGITLLSHTELKQVNFFREQDTEIYNSASVTFYKLYVQMPLLESRFS